MSSEHDLKFYVPEHLKHIPVQSAESITIAVLELAVQATLADESDA